MELKTAQKYLLDRGIVSEEQIRGAIELINNGTYPEKTSIPQILFNDGVITEIQYTNALGAEYGIEVVDFSNVAVQPQLKGVISKTIAQKHKVLPVMEDGNNLYIAVDDPTNYAGIEAVKKLSKKKILPLLSPPSILSREIMVLYGTDNASRAIDDLKKDMHADDFAENIVESLETTKDGASAAEKLVNTILEEALVERASDIHFEPHQEESVIRMRIDGMLRDTLTIPKETYRTVISRIKVMGNMDVSERRRPQDGRYSFVLRNQEIDLRISSIPTIMGEKIVIRILNKSKGIRDKNAIGLTSEDLQKYEQLINNHSGVILMVGPTGSGKSSTMYTMIKALNTKDVNLMTLEDPVEYNVDGVNQIQINNKINMTFANGLRTAMRQDPDIIVVGEIRDGETADIAMRAAITGHLVISTLHTNDSVSAFARLQDIGVEPYLISNAMLGVISQRLVRRICPNCKEEYIPNEKELSILGDPEEYKNHKFYHGTGCPLCHDTGYVDRIGVFEILLMSPELRRAITTRAPKEELMKIARKNGLVTLRENCTRLVLNGTTTLSEMKRTINAIE